ncbi:MAG: hypothetical protein WD967_00660 [Candidatus Levyibacteriota bacterium]
MDQLINNVGPNADFKTVISEVIKKQIVILGPAITIAKARNVKGLTVADDGTVTDIQGPPQEIIQALIDQFIQLSGLIVRKTMEPLLANYPDGVKLPENQDEATIPSPVDGTQAAPSQPTSQQNPTPSSPTMQNPALPATGLPEALQADQPNAVDSIK